MNKNLIILITAVLFLMTGKAQAENPGLYVEGRFLYTPSGEKLILKGFNAMIVYWDLHGEINFPEIEKTGANCVRIFWKLDGWTPPASDLDKVLTNCIENNMIPIICLWDATGNWEKIQFCVNYWCTPAIAAVLKKHEKNLIVNIANEPGNKAMGDGVFTATYSDAVQQMRNAGIKAPLIIDADTWGRNANSVLNTGTELLELDPEHNLIFSWHLWDPATRGTGRISEIDRIIDTAVEKNICFIVGEFGPCEQCTNCVSTKINWEYLIEKCYTNEIGYLPWVWRWTDCHSCIVYEPGNYGDWTNSPWGEGVALTHQYSIKNTAIRPPGMITAINNQKFNGHNIMAYPNPSSGSVNFLIDAGYKANISLKIYSLTGIEVAVVEDNKLVSGTYKTQWYPNLNVASGVYLYRLSVENSSTSFVRQGKFVKD